MPTVSDKRMVLSDVQAARLLLGGKRIRREHSGWPCVQWRVVGDEVQRHVPGCDGWAQCAFPLLCDGPWVVVEAKPAPATLQDCLEAGAKFLRRAEWGDDWVQVRAPYMTLHSRQGGAWMPRLVDLTANDYVMKKYRGDEWHSPNGEAYD